jgi:histidinol phosphatase-like PHP family hydrolase
MQHLTRYDCHVHTISSPCGKPDMTVRDIVEQARRLKLAGFCLTDHLHPETERDQFVRLRAAVDAVSQSDMQLWVGCEAELLTVGTFSIKATDLSLVDLVLVAPFHGDYCEDRPKGETEEEIADFMLRLLNSALDCPGARIIVHPLWMAMEWPFDLERVIKMMLSSPAMTDLLKKATTAGIAMEVNPKMLSGPFIGLAEPFYLRCLDQNVKLSFGSDAHTLSRMDVWDDFEHFFNKLGADVSEDLWLPNVQLMPV